jgi:outer membrane biosynthesis protein TonB
LGKITYVTVVLVKFMSGRTLMLALLVSILFMIQPVYSNFCAVNVESTPEGAAVYIDGEFVGNTPVYYTLGDPAVVEVVVIKEGYKEFRQKVEVPLDEVVDVVVELEPAEASETPTEKVAPEAPPEEEEKTGEKAKPVSKSVCGPVALLAIATVPPGLRRLFSSR